MEVTKRSWKSEPAKGKNRSGITVVRKGDTKQMTARPATVPPKKSGKAMLSSDSAIKKKPENVKKVMKPASSKLNAMGMHSSRKK